MRLIDADDLAAKIMIDAPDFMGDMKWNPDCEDCLPEGIDDCIECHKRREGR